MKIALPTHHPEAALERAWDLQSVESFGGFTDTKLASRMASLPVLPAGTVKVVISDVGSSKMTPLPDT